jgi:hypothetical protein
VREPFPSKVTGTQLGFGVIDTRHALTITSHIADIGVIFSDGIEADCLSFYSGATASIGLAGKNLSPPEVDNEYLN